MCVVCGGETAANDLRYNPPPPPSLTRNAFAMCVSDFFIPQYHKRGCPVDILRAQHDSHKSIQTDISRVRVSRLPGNFDVWTAARAADDAVESG